MREVPPQIAERLPAAAELFAESGLNETKIEDVATATGIAKATLYYYFAGKEDILAYLLEDALGEIADDVAAVVHADGTGAERLSGVIGAQLRVMARRPAVCRALIGELGRAARMPVIAEMISSAYYQPVEALLIAGASDGSLVAQHDPRSVAIALFGAVTTSALTYLITDDTLDEALVARSIHTVMFDGLRPR
ncbi:bacterial regulatory s, tetR family protein [Mycobacterium kansasii 662]|uniref:Fatty acid metabolism regulator protein n=2 Tax=Mycobacterium TaxID=1763 RepID=A0A498R0N0_9MYCO|nr:MULTISPECIES: TetR/AcrR family transcriptional regulator [Mycobacterium]EUA09800.1 bacterial regulatory s, tetR family protein [Mycobacterium kansasii 662]UCA22999.1 TetR/AcrR family transcriptional regulator [Mycobacterium kansasii]VBA68763.1 Fatty acid metabolism regulator protein [Mycobacterium pseudokansasii]